MSRYTLIQILVMTLVTHAIRVIPLLVFRKPIENKFIRSFLYYIPYASLAVMTFPAMIYSTDYLLSGILAFAAGMILSYRNVALPKLAGICVAIVFASELVIRSLSAL